MLTGAHIRQRREGVRTPSAGRLPVQRKAVRRRELVVTYSDADSHIGEAEAASDFQWVTNFILQPGYYVLHVIRVIQNQPQKRGGGQIGLIGILVRRHGIAALVGHVNPAGHPRVVVDDAHLDGAVYYMDVKGGFYLDEFVAQGGASSDAELISFITGGCRVRPGR